MSKPTDDPAVHCAFKKMVPIESIKPRENNPNNHSEEQIRRLAGIIAFQGWRNPIVVSNLSGTVTRGHGRLLAAKRLGLTKVPVDFQDYSDAAQENADVIADNVIAELSEFDPKLLSHDIAELMKSGVSIEQLGWNESEFRELEVELAKAIAPPKAPNKVVSFVTKPKASEDQYSQFELVMLHTHKLKLVDALTRVKKDNPKIETNEGALMALVEFYETNAPK